MIIFDLDGTLADCEHRRHYVDVNHIKNKTTALDDGNITWDQYKKHWKPNWKAFYEECDKDEPICPTVYVCNSYILLDNDVEIWSGRCESVREKTREWLDKHMFSNHLYHIRLKMRPEGDNTPDDQLKERWLDEELEKNNKIKYVFDDRPKVVRMWRRRGIFVFDCNQSGKEF